MKKRFVKIDGRQLHFRYTGKGRPIILFHASPSSSKMMVPLMEQLKTHFMVIAVDTPGYGLSDSMPEEEAEIKDYVRYFKRFFDQLGLNRFAIYGTATGAQLAIRYALTYPEQVSRIYLDNAAHFTDPQRQAILEDYFPDLSPRQDGSHLQTLWKIVRNLFTYFPWSNPKPENHLGIPTPPAAVLHQVALDYLQSGSEYDQAYRAAFHHEQAAYVQQLSVPTTVFHWEGSIVLRYVEQLLSFDFPDEVQVIPIPAKGEERLVRMAAHIFQTYQEALDYEWPSARLETQGQLYLPTAGGLLHAIGHLNPGEPPLVLLHDWRSSAAIAYATFQESGIDHSVLAISLPGHGDSDHLMENYVETKVAELVTTALARAGIQEYELVGFGRGESIAEQIHQQKGISIGEWPQLQQESLHLPKLVVDPLGQYLMKAWKHLQKYSSTDQMNQEEDELADLFNSMEADRIQLQLREWLKCKY